MTEATPNFQVVFKNTGTVLIDRTSLWESVELDGVLYPRIGSSMFDGLEGKFIMPGKEWTSTI